MEFAISALALLAFLMAIFNLGMLGFSLGALARGVQAAARNSAVYTSAQFTSSKAFVTPSCATTVGYFNSAVSPPLPAAGTSVGSNPLLSISWTNNAGSTVGSYPPGVILTLTGSYSWVPFGFDGLFSGIPLKISTVATVMGTAGTTSTITITAASCS